MKSIIIFFCVFMNIVLFAQDKNFGIAVQISSPNSDELNVGWFNIDNESIDGWNLSQSSISGGVLFNYYKSDETTFRIRLGLTNTNINEWQLINNNPNEKFSVNASQFKFQLAPGINWAVNSNNFQIIGGFEFPFNYHGNYVIVGDQGTFKYIIPAGYSFGIGAIMGFNYNINEWLSLNAEYSPNILYANLAGRTTITTPNNPSAGSLHSEDSNSGFVFYNQRFSFGATIKL